MAVKDDKKVLRAAGKCCANPTDLTLPFPHGGTALGDQAFMEAYYDQRHFAVIAEELDEVVEVARGAVRGRVDLVFRQWDADALALFYDAELIGDQPQLAVPGDRIAGALGSSTAVTLMISPDRLGDPALIVHVAIPTVGATLPVRYGNLRELQFVARFDAIRDSSSRMYSMGALDEISVDPTPWFDALVPGASFLLTGESRMWQDAEGTVLATADGDPVRRVQDARGLASYLTTPDGATAWEREVIDGHVGIRPTTASTATLSGDGIMTAAPPAEIHAAVDTTGANSGTRAIATIRNPDTTDKIQLRQNSGGTRTAGAFAQGTEGSTGATSADAFATDSGSFVAAQWEAGRISRSVSIGLGSVVSQGAIRTTTGLTSLILGAVDGVPAYDGTLLAIVVYPFTLGSAQRAANAAVLAARFGVTL